MIAIIDQAAQRNYEEIQKQIESLKQKVLKKTVEKVERIAHTERYEEIHATIGNIEGELLHQVQEHTHAGDVLNSQLKKLLAKFEVVQELQLWLKALESDWQEFAQNKIRHENQRKQYDRLFIKPARNGVMEFEKITIKDFSDLEDKIKAIHTQVEDAIKWYEWYIKIKQDELEKEQLQQLEKQKFELEKQKFELEKQKLEKVKMEKQKLELEKQKLEKVKNKFKRYTQSIGIYAILATVIAGYFYTKYKVHSTIFDYLGKHYVPIWFYP